MVRRLSHLWGRARIEADGLQADHVSEVRLPVYVWVGWGVLGIAISKCKCIAPVRCQKCNEATYEPAQVDILMELLVALDEAVKGRADAGQAIDNFGGAEAAKDVLHDLGGKSGDVRTRHGGVR